MPLAMPLLMWWSGSRWQRVGCGEAAIGALPSTITGLDALLAGEKPTQRVQSWLFLQPPEPAQKPRRMRFWQSLAKHEGGYYFPGAVTRLCGAFPELTTSMPAHIAASTGIDAFATYWSVLPRPWQIRSAITRADWVK